MGLLAVPKLPAAGLYIHTLFLRITADCVTVAESRRTRVTHSVSWHPFAKSFVARRRSVLRQPVTLSRPEHRTCLIGDSEAPASAETSAVASQNGTSRVSSDGTRRTRTVGGWPSVRRLKTVSLSGVGDHRSALATAEESYDLVEQVAHVSSKRRPAKAIPYIHTGRVAPTPC